MLDVTARFETKIFHIGCGFWCEITLDKDAEFGPIYRCYVWDDKSEQKEFMFGLPEYQFSGGKHYGWDEIVEVVESNVDDFIRKAFMFS